jgi:hypothetical protein
VERLLLLRDVLHVLAGDLLPLDGDFLDLSGIDGGDELREGDLLVLDPLRLEGRNTIASAISIQSARLR